MFDNTQASKKGFSIHYINIITNNDVGILNRITNLIRKRNYNIEELNLAFNSDGEAHFLVGFHNDNVNIQQIAAQLEKLYDVKSVEIIPDLQRIKKTYYVYAQKQKDFNTLSILPHTITTLPDECVGFYMFDYKEGHLFREELDRKKFKYLKKTV